MAQRTVIVTTCDLCGDQPAPLTVTLDLQLSGANMSDTVVAPATRGGRRQLDLCAAHDVELLTVVRWWEAGTPAPPVELSTRRGRRRTG